MVLLLASRLRRNPRKHGVYVSIGFARRNAEPTFEICYIECLHSSRGEPAHITA